MRIRNYLCVLVCAAAVSVTGCDSGGTADRPDVDEPVITDTTVVADTADVEFQAKAFSGMYYGNSYGQNGEYCFNAYLLDTPMTDMQLAPGSTAYLFDFFTGEPEDKSKPVPQPGHYTLGEAGATAAMTFTPELSCILYQEADGTVRRTYFSEGTLDISENGENTVFEAFLTDTDGRTHYVTYTGPAEYISEGGSGYELLPLEKDLDFTAVTVDALWLADMGDGVMEVNLVFTDMFTDEAGYVIPPGSILYVDAFMPFDEDGALTPGTYTVTSQAAAPGTLFPGTLMEMAEGVLFPAGTFVDWMDESETAYTGLIDSGVMTISGGPGDYSVNCEFTTEEGFSIKCVYDGDMSVKMAPQKGLIKNPCRSH